MNYYDDDELAIQRLVKEYSEHKNLIIGFDFDNTILDYHQKGLDVLPVILLLKRCSRIGFTMCLYTITPLGEDLHKKINYCLSHNIVPTHINASPIFQEQEGFSKPFFSILLDDRAGLSSAYKILNETLNRLDL